MSDEEKGQARREVDFLSELDHHHIVQYVANFVQDSTLHIVMEYCEGGDLASLIKRSAKDQQYFDEEDILDWFVQITMAVSFIHSKRVLHRDLKVCPAHTSRCTNTASANKLTTPPWY